jgi:predicted DNA-binding protein (MmcQ/YjbR family)
MTGFEAILKRVRRLCQALPGTAETITFGNPTFQVAKKTFVVLEEYKAELTLCFKVGREVQGIFLKDPRFFSTPYVGRYGWVSLRVHAAPLDWNEVAELTRCSYRLIAPKKLANQVHSPSGAALRPAASTSGRRSVARPQGKPR